jgi:hypothetical protein
MTVAGQTIARKITFTKYEYNKNSAERQTGVYRPMKKKHPTYTE